MTALPLIALLLLAPTRPIQPTISLDLRRVVEPRSGQAIAPDAKVEDLAVQSLPKSGSDSVIFVVTIHALGSGDVFFDKRAVRVEIRDQAGIEAPYTCLDKRSLPEEEFVRLRPGETLQRLLSSDCRHPLPGQKYTVVAVFESVQSDYFRQTVPDGATLVTKRIQSKKLPMKWPSVPRSRITRR